MRDITTPRTGHDGNTPLDGEDGEGVADALGGKHPAELGADAQVGKGLRHVCTSVVVVAYLGESTTSEEQR